MPGLVGKVGGEARPVRCAQPEAGLGDVTGQRDEPIELLVEAVLNVGGVGGGADRAGAADP